MITRDSSIINQKILEEYDAVKAPFIVTIGGLSCSGKTTLSGKIQKHLERENIDVTYVSLDNWIIDIDKRPLIQTVRVRFDYYKIKENIESLLNGNDCLIFRYNKKLRKKNSSPEYIKPVEKGVYIIEGVVALDIEYLNKIADYKIFVETSNKIRIDRFSILHRKIKGLSELETKEILRSRETDENILIEKTKNIANTIFYN